MTQERSIVGFVCGFTAVMAGCHAVPKPAPVPTPRVAQSRPSVAGVAPSNIRRYLAASQSGTSVYRRRDMHDGAEVEYVRRTSADRLVEGDRTWSFFEHASDYLNGGGEDLTESDSPGGLVLRYALEDPLALIPDDLTASSPSTSTTRMDYMDLNRRPAGHGVLTRTAAIEGIEDVECPAGHFADCLHIRIDLNLKIHWGPTIDWAMDAWLSPQVGDVKRRQQLSGWLLIIPFGSTFEYDLVSYTPPAASQPPDTPPLLWQDGIMAFDRAVPSPRLGALLVNFAQ